MDTQLEIACFNLESALTAAKSGADRLELCADCEAGGTTPLVEIIKIIAYNRKRVPFNFVFSNQIFSNQLQLDKEQFFKLQSILGFRQKLLTFRKMNIEKRCIFRNQL